MADVGIGKDTSGDEQAEQVIRQEEMVDQAATPFSGAILVEAILQELGLALARHTGDVQVGGAG